MGSYCTTQDVAEMLGLPEFPQTGPVTEAVVDKWITRMEDRADQIMGSSFKKQTATEEYHHYNPNDNRRETGVPIFLDHDHLYDFDSTKGDKIEIWDGSSYEQLQTTGTEGRASEYWFDLVKGILFLRLGTRSGIVNGVRVTYRYGDFDAVPGDITDAVALLVASRVVQLDGTAALLQSEGLEVPPSERVNMMKKEATDILSSRRGFKSIGAMPEF